MVDFFQFNDYGEMTSAYVNGKKSTYSYRPDGLRINKTVDGVTTRHVLDGQNVSMDLNDDWNTKFSFIRGVRLVGYIDDANGSKYFYNFNAHGDVLGAVGGLNSTAQTRYTYDAFGNSSKTGSSANPFGYFGQYHDAESGFIYLRARYYNPAAGRFISEDTHWNPENMIYGDDEDLREKKKIVDVFAIQQSINLYSYSMGNPVSFIDETGNLSRVAWYSAASALGGVDCVVASFMMKHSLRDNPSNIYIQGKGNNGMERKIVSKIKVAKELRSKINQMVQLANSIQETSISTNSWSKKGTTLANSITFSDDKDLMLAFNNMSANIYGEIINGYWVFSITLTDRYDFEEGAAGAGAVGMFNDQAAADQAEGIINPYNITITFAIVFQGTYKGY